MTREAEQIDYHDDFATALKKIYDYEMTRDERVAISILNAYKVGYESGMEDLEQQPCDDAISREAVIEATHHCGDLQEVRGVVQQLPSVNPQPSEHFIDGVHAMGYREGYKDAQKQKSGKWLYKEITDDYRVTGQCSECKERRIIDNYCPNCGAKMESEVKNEV